MSDLKPECQAIYTELEHLKDCRQVIINFLKSSPQIASDKFIIAQKEELERLNLAIEELEQQLQNCQTQ